MGRPYRRRGAAARNRRRHRCAGATRDPAGGSGSRAVARAPIPLPGDPRAALRPDRRVPGGPLRRGRDHAARRRARDGHGGATRGRRATATTPRTSRSSSPSRPAGPRATSPAWSPRGSTAADGIAGVEVAGPGLPQHQRRRRRPGRRSPTTSSRPGRRTAAPRRAQKQKVNIEFVSANPTGPVTLASARWAAVGDTLARLLEATGYRGHPGVLLQRPRRPDRPVQPVAARGRAARADARGRLPGAVHRRDRRSRSSPHHPEAPGLPDDEALEAFRAVRRRA